MLLRTSFPFLLLMSVCLVPLNAWADDDHDRAKRTTTGRWVTQSAAPLVLQSIDGPVVSLTNMAWTLIEDENGLITGFNSALTTDERGNDAEVSALCMVGARNGSRVVISEAHVAAPTIPIFLFNCEQRKNKKLRCLGNGLADIEPVALQGTLVRQKMSIEAVDLATEEILNICQPNRDRNL